MKKNLFLAIGVVASLVQGASAQTQTLLTTYEDFNNAGNSTGSLDGAATTASDLDGSSINGLANSTAPGAAGTPGAESVTWTSGTYDTLTVAYAGGMSSVFSALESASTFSFEYTQPASAGTGTYFQLLLLLNYQGGYDQISGSSTSLGGGVYLETIPFTTEASHLATVQGSNGGSFNYFNIGIIYNSNWNAPGSPFVVDDFQVTAAPEPGSWALMGTGALSLLGFARRRSRQA